MYPWLEVNSNLGREDHYPPIVHVSRLCESGCTSILVQIQTNMLVSVRATKKKTEKPAYFSIGWVHQNQSKVGPKMLLKSCTGVTCPHRKISGEKPYLHTHATKLLAPKSLENDGDTHMLQTKPKQNKPKTACCVFPMANGLRTFSCLVAPLFSQC